MKLSLIVAMSGSGVIGDRGLPWRLPRDLRRFRALTWGKPLIVGRRTHELIGRPLPGRDTIVLTRDESFHPDGAHVARDPDAALALAADLSRRRSADEVFVIGGAEVYRLFLDRVDRVYLTLVEGNFAGTATFPVEQLLAGRWAIRHYERIPADEANPHPHQFLILERDAEALPRDELARLLARTD
jgi:dihydrofolate reductase